VPKMSGPDGSSPLPTDGMCPIGGNTTQPDRARAVVRKADAALTSGVEGAVGELLRWEGWDSKAWQGAP
jgi:hypothetical protein